MTGADPGFWVRGGLINIFTTGGGYERGRAPPVTAKGSGGALRAPPVGSGPLVCFSMKLTVISIHVHHAISGLLL